MGKEQHHPLVPSLHEKLGVDGGERLRLVGEVAYVFGVVGDLPANPRDRRGLRVGAGICRTCGCRGGYSGCLLTGARFFSRAVSRAQLEIAPGGYRAWCATHICS